MLKRMSQNQKYREMRAESAMTEFFAISKSSAISALLLTGGLCAAVAVMKPEEVLADANVASMDITVELEEDGSAYITQQWEAYADDGTEYYLYFKDSGYLSFDNLTVHDDTTTYNNIGEWDIDADFDEKAYCCGINYVEDGVELCWGISEYGNNHYTISYTVGGLVGAYDDEDGFLYRFVNSDMDIFPSSVNLTIEMADGTPLSEENASIWGFGYEGEIMFMDGKIRAWTEEDLEDDANMTLMVSMNPDLLDCEENWVGENFEDIIDNALADSSYVEEFVEEGYWGSDTYYDEEYFEYDDGTWYYYTYGGYGNYTGFILEWKGNTYGYYDYNNNDQWVDMTSYQKTLESLEETVDDGDILDYYLDGSSEIYENSDILTWDGTGDWDFELDMIPALFICLFIGIIVYLLIKSILDGDPDTKLYQNLRTACNGEYYKKVPLDGDLDMAYALALGGNLCDEGSIISARIMRLVMIGAVEISWVNPEGSGSSTNSGSSYNAGEEVLFLRPDWNGEGDTNDQKLVKLLKKAAIGQKYLTKEMLNRFTEKNSGRIEEYLSDCLSAGKRHLEIDNLTDGEGKLTSNGRNEYQNLCRLYNYIYDYDTASAGNASSYNSASDTAEDESNWIELLPYAVLFDLITEFGSDMKKMYSTQDYEDYIRPIFWSGYYCHNYNRIIRNNISNNNIHSSRSGSGGDFSSGSFSSFSGGGGHSSFGGGGGFSGGGGGGHR